jgi:hypothetical protein
VYIIANRCGLLLLNVYIYKRITTTTITAAAAVTTTVISILLVLSPF